MFFYSSSKIWLILLKSIYILPVLTTIIQYYNYALFGLSASVLAKNYFPNSDISLQILQIFAVIAFSAVARPIGSIIFGTIGDIYGRSYTLKITVIIFIISSGLTAILPDYNTIGIFSTICLLLLRMLLIAGLAGESDGIRIYITEKVSKKQQYFSNGIVTACTQIGVLLASASCILVEYNFYNWRYNFAIGGFLGFVILFFRFYWYESVEFTNYQKSDSYLLLSKLSIKQIIVNYFKLLSIGIVITGAVGGLYSFYILFFPAYIHNILHINTSINMKICIFFMLILFIITSIIAGKLSDIYSPRKIMLISCIILLILSVVICLYLANAQIKVITLFMVAIFMPFYSVPAQIYFKNRLQIGVCYRIFSLSHSIGSLIL